MSDATQALAVECQTQGLLWYAFFDQAALTQTQRKVISAAVLLFDQKGFFNTSVADLVAVSGVSSGSIYHGFKDKQAIAECLMQTLLTQIESALQAVVVAHDTGWARYQHLVAWMMQTTQTYPAVMRFVLHARHQEFLPDQPPVCAQQPFTTLRRVLSEAQAAGEIAPRPLMQAAALAYGPVFRWMQFYLDGLVDSQALDDWSDLIHQAWWLLQTPAPNKGRTTDE